MKTITDSKFEPILINYFSTTEFKQNYELSYRIRALKFANLLYKQLGGDIDVICALVLLKRPTVRFFEFEEDAGEDIPGINIVLETINFPENKRPLVVESLQNLYHQKPVRIENKIVNDAFLLSDSGATGLVRFFMWNGYRSSDTKSLADINILFKEKLSKLVTPQGLNLAEKEIKSVYLFSALLQQEPFVEDGYLGRYIVLEGNSGTGKNTQAELLKTYLENKRISVMVVHEPTPFYRDFEAYIASKMQIDLSESAPIFRLYSIIGDRYHQIQSKVKQALVNGYTVISIRSYISMLVYQCEGELDRLYVNFMHRFVPRPDVAILYDATEEVCLQRVLKRGTHMTPFDKLESLKKHRPIFLDVVKSQYFDFPFEVIDASGSEEQVAADTIKVISKHIKIFY